jgi:hypothetical protein
MIAVERSDLGNPEGSAAGAPARDLPAHRVSSDEDSLSDEDLRSEIELVADLVVAASTDDGPLSQPEIDRILGVDRP